MNRRDMILRTGAAALGFAFFPSTWSQDRPTRKILFFTKSSGFEHSTIRRQNGKPSFAEKVLSELGPRHHFDFTFSKDGSLFSRDYLGQFHAFFFYTTGDLTTPGTDKNPPMSHEGKAAFLEAVKNGKGFIGTHSASDTFHSPGSRDENNAELDPYIQMLGGEFIIHGAQQISRLRPADKKFPGLGRVPAKFAPKEEWYSLKNFAPDLHVLLVQETEGMKGWMYDRAPYPSTWARPHGQGRVFYTNMGHREDIWTNPVFQTVLLGGLDWATRNVDAEIPPNIDQVTPQARELPVRKAARR